MEMRGVARRSGILMPAHVQEFTFCQPLCFWAFIVEQMPENLTIPPELQTPRVSRPRNCAN